MSIRFPAADDVPLARSPLTEVICQVRYPPILSIGHGLPVQFQDAIRKRFPELDEQHAFQIQINAGGISHQQFPDSMGRTYQFRTSDGTATVGLGTESYALSTTNYSSWEEFGNDLALVHGAAMAVYGLPYAKRVGLRYINQLNAVDYGFNSKFGFSSILRSELVGLLETEVWSDPEELVSQVRLRENEARMVVRVGVRDIPETGPVILLDFDYYEEGQMPLHDLVERCDQYHDIIYRAFRWAINDESLRLFGPIRR